MCFLIKPFGTCIILCILYSYNIHQCQLFCTVLKACHKGSCSVKGCKYIYTCFNGITADHKTVMASFSTLCWYINNQIDLMALYQVKDVWRLLLQFTDL